MKSYYNIGKENRMKIYYDYQILLGQKYGGISRYFFELASAISRTNDAEVSFCAPLYRSTYFECYFHHHSIRGFFEKHLGFCNKIDRLSSVLNMKTVNYDIIHPTFYDPYLLGKYNGKLVITVYDMIQEKLPQYFIKDKTIENKHTMMEMADHVIAISESTKRDILNVYPDIDENKISVIYIASNFHKMTDDSVADKFPKQYILFVGNRTGYKNFDLFFDSIKPLLEADGSLYLICLGGGKFSANELEKQGVLHERIIQMDVNDSILSYGYSHALCFVFPSLYEGFGIPTLEAFACDCPVVLSNTSSMPEVGGNAAVYIDPYDSKDIYAKVRNVIKNESLRKTMVEKGRQQLLKFNWDNIAKQTLECYKDVLKD